MTIIKNPKSCPSSSVEMPVFLDQLFGEKRDYIIDFLLETSLSHKVSPKNISHLDDISYILRNCYIPDRRECKYENTRVHWVDVRYTGLLGEYIKIYIQIITYRKFFPEHFKELNLDGDVIKKNLIRKLRNVEQRFDVDKVLIESKVMKQINNIEDPHIQKKFLLEIRNKIRWTYDKFVRLLYRPTIIYPSVELTNALINFALLFVDAYTIGRMLKSYNGEQMKNIIIYAGGKHSDNISEILQKIDFDLVGSIGIDTREVAVMRRYTDKFQCLDITPLLPLFG